MGPEKVGEEVSCAEIWGKSIPGSENSRCKGTGAKVNLACLSNSKEVSVLGEDEQKGRGGQEVREAKGRGGC